MMFIEIILLIAEGMAIGSILFCEINFFIILWKICEYWVKSQEDKSENSTDIDLKNTD